MYDPLEKWQTSFISFSSWYLEVVKNSSLFLGIYKYSIFSKIYEGDRVVQKKNKISWESWLFIIFLCLLLYGWTCYFVRLYWNMNSVRFSLGKKHFDAQLLFCSGTLIKFVPVPLTARKWCVGLHVDLFHYCLAFLSISYYVLVMSTTNIIAYWTHACVSH